MGAVNRSGGSVRGLVERHDEQAQIHHVLGRARAGEGRVALVEGPPGIGKTSLLEAAAAHALDLDATVLSAAGDEMETGFAFGAVLQLFESVSDELIDTSPGVAALLRGLPIDDSQDHDVLRGLTKLTRALCSTSTVVIVADDVQWWDAPSARFLAYLCRRVDRLSIAVLVGARSDALDDGIPARIAASAHTRLRPAALSLDAVGDIVRDNIPSATPELIAAYLDATGGNPFLLCALLDDERDPDAATELLSRTAPSAVTAHVARRLATVSPRDRNVTDAITTLSEEAYPRHVITLTEMSAVEVERSITRLVQAHLVVDDRPLRIVHPLVRSAVLNSMPEASRRELHRRAARALLDDGVAEERVAHHLLESPVEGATWVVDTLRRAAERVRMVGAPAEAARYLRRALAESADPSVRGALLLDLGRAESAYSPDDAVRSLQAAAEAFGEGSECGVVHTVLGHVFLMIGRLREARDAFEHAMTHEAASEDDSLRRAVGWVTAARTDVETRQLARHRLAELTTKAPPGRTRAERAVLAELAYEEGLAGRSARTTTGLALRAFGGRSLEHFGGVDRATRQGATLALMWAGELDLVERAAAALIEEGSDDGHDSVLALGYHLTATCLFLRGRVRDALEPLGKAIELTDGAGTFFVPGIHAMRAMVLLERDDLQGAIDALTALPGGDAAWNTVASYHPHLLAQSYVALRTGDAERALRLARRCEEFSEVMGTWNPGVIDWREPMVHALAALGEAREARSTAEKGLELARRFGAARPIGRSLVTLAVVTPPGQRAALLREAGEQFVAAGDDLGQANALAELALVAPTSERDHLQATAAALADRIGADYVRRRLAISDAPAPERATVSVRLFGAFEIRRDGQPLPAPPAAARLVKLLALARRPVHVEEVIEELWPDDAVERGRARLRNLHARVRQAYGDVVQRNTDRLRLVDHLQIDLWRFDDAAEAAFEASKAGDPGVDPLARAAIAMVGDELLPEDPYAPWATVSREHVRAQLVDLLDMRAAIAEDRGDRELAAALLQRAAELDEYDHTRFERAATLLEAEGRTASANHLRSRAKHIRDELSLD
jgi:DNA-binding SARP family transcriptional activator